MKALFELALIVAPILYLFANPSFEAVGAVFIGAALALALGSSSTVSR